MTSKKNLVLTIIVIFISFLTLHSQTSIKTLLLGHWKNCDAVSFRSESAILYKNIPDTCKNKGTGCLRTQWDFTQDTLTSTLKIKITSVCEESKIADSWVVNHGPVTWRLNERKKTLQLTYGKEKYIFKIISLDQNKLEIKQKE